MKKQLILTMKKQLTVATMKKQLILKQRDDIFSLFSFPLK